jgi:hypothetical protein
MTPLGKALLSSIDELGITGEFKNQILRKYEEAIEKEFQDLPVPR